MERLLDLAVGGLRTYSRLLTSATHSYFNRSQSHLLMIKLCIKCCGCKEVTPCFSQGYSSNTQLRKHGSSNPFGEFDQLFCFVPSWLSVAVNKVDMSSRTLCSLSFCVNKVTRVTCQLPSRFHYKYWVVDDPQFQFSSSGLAFFAGHCPP